MIVLKILIIVIVISLLGIIINIIEESKKCAKISFKETMDLLNVPIISFICKGKKLHFLLDSGSSYSHISPKAVKLIKGKVENINTVRTVGAGGMLHDNSHCILKLEYNKEYFDSDFIVTEQITQQLDAIKNDFNIEMHGVLGGDFLNRYNYIIDFKELAAYSKK